MPCRRALRRARNVFTGATRDRRCGLLRRETVNLLAVSNHFTWMREAAVAETAALRVATADIERQRQILLRQREADKARLAEIVAQQEGEDPM